MSQRSIPQNAQVTIPLDEWARAIAVEAARVAVSEHMAACPQAPAVLANTKMIVKNAETITTLRLRWSLLVGLMASSGLLGGTVGSILNKLI